MFLMLSVRLRSAPRMPLNTAMILAAGRGERLRPLTDRIPKPLVQVGKVSLIERHLESLVRCGIQRVVVNVAHLGDQIMDALGDGSRFGVDVLFSREPEGALETAGGIAHALPLLGDAPFVVVNGDVLCDLPSDYLVLDDSCDMHLLLVDNPAHHPEGDFSLNTALHPARLTARSPAANSYTYAGIGCFRPDVFRNLPEQRYPLLPLINDAIACERASALIHDGYWFDIGSSERLGQARTYFSDPTPTNHP